MRSILLGLSALVVCAVAKTPKPFSGYAANYSLSEYYPNATEWSVIESEVAKYNVSVDWSALEQKAGEIDELFEAVEDRWEAYEEYEANYNLEQQKEIQKALQDTYKTTLGKLMMEYGTLVEPLLNHTAKIEDGLQFNGTCNDDCAIQCWVPEKYDTFSGEWVFGYNATCVQRCGCEFKFESFSNYDREQFNADAETVESELEHLEQYGAEMASNAQNVIVPALERFNKRASDLQNEYVKTVRATAIVDLGCNESCVNTCTNYYHYTFFQLSGCLSNCYCTGIESALQLEEGTYSMPQLVLYAKGNHAALKSFHALKAKF